jgi:hypothetical protein
LLLLILLLGLPLLVRPEKGHCHQTLPERLAQIFEKDHESVVPDEKSTEELGKARFWNPARLVGSTEGTVRCWAPCIRAAKWGSIGARRRYQSCKVIELDLASSGRLLVWVVFERGSAVGGSNLCGSAYECQDFCMDRLCRPW